MFISFIYSLRYIGLLCEVLEWQKNHGLTNKENTALAIKCESPLSPQSRRLRLKRPYFEDESRSKMFLESEQTKYGNEENEEKRQRNFCAKTEFIFGKDHLRVLRNHYYFPPRWRQNVPFRNLTADKNGNNLLMIAPQNGKDDKGFKDKDDGKNWK